MYFPGRPNSISCDTFNGTCTVHSLDEICDLVVSNNEIHSGEHTHPVIHLDIRPIHSPILRRLHKFYKKYKYDDATVAFRIEYGTNRVKGSLLVLEKQPNLTFATAMPLRDPQFVSGHFADSLPIACDESVGKFSFMVHGCSATKDHVGKLYLAQTCTFSEPKNGVSNEDITKCIEEIRPHNY